MFNKNLSGFSLLEVLTVIVIVGILVALGLPLYMNYIRQADVSEVKNYIAQMRLAEKKYYQIHNSYFASSDIDEIKQNLDVSIDKKIRNLWDFSITKNTNSEEYIIILASGKSGTKMSNIKIEYSSDTGEFSIID
ncbi:MAG: prepilin-type N-terminal cleavage/methylation domain-containing protein [Candidatus Mcinerneyibacterium aminivorans]|uniref:Prepilin-type N-terminal cleavage/methylation domain-containing protein n=1 Tax=Candidatus Mcinerneyibacterium aminivorans TaxID=2703815 RepID=A0A5D0MA27_9BACT|nr:MAG: prepilin-type N-terminal cleavage/methylation domain-containing protein [Candidatus Mcinerneyibacterium aminivorans]